MKFLILDSVPEYSPVVEKEGSQLYIALKKLGHTVALAGQRHTQILSDLPSQSEDFDVCILTDNYPERWDWNRFRKIRIPKIFWAIDSHLRKFDFVINENFQGVLFNCFTHIDRFMSDPKWQSQVTICDWFPYAADPGFFSTFDGSQRYDTNSRSASEDVVFCGHLDEARSREITAFQKLSKIPVACLVGYGQSYIDNILSGRINVNLPNADDFNAKIVHILALGRMLLSRRNINSAAVIPDRLGIYFSDLPELRDKAEWLLASPRERERLARDAQSYVLAHHTWELRAKQLVDLAATF